METKPFNLQSPESIAKEYGGNKQKIAVAAKMGLIDPTAAVLAGMFIDRMRAAQAAEQAPQQTIAEQTFSPAPQAAPPDMPPANAPMEPAAPSALGATPEAAQIAQAMPPMPEAPQAGLDALPEPNQDFAEGGLVAFAEGGPAEEMARGGLIDVAKSLFPDIRITSGYRGEGNALSKKNPRSWHKQGSPDNPTAIDVAPIKGMEFEDFVKSLKRGGLHILEAIDEVKNPSKHATGPHWHVAARAGGKGDGDEEISVGPRQEAKSEQEPRRKSGLATIAAIRKALGRDGEDGGGIWDLMDRLGLTKEASFAEGGPVAANYGFNPKSVMDWIETFRGQFGPVNDPYSEEALRRLSERNTPEAKAKAKKRDMWETLAEIGFGIAANPSPYFLQAVGESASKALPGAKESRQARDAQEMKDLETQAGIMKSRRGEEREMATVGVGASQTQANLAQQQSELQAQTASNAAKLAFEERKLAAEIDRATKDRQVELQIEQLRAQNADTTQNRAAVYYKAFKLRQSQGVPGYTRLDGKPVSDEDLWVRAMNAAETARGSGKNSDLKTALENVVNPGSGGAGGAGGQQQSPPGEGWGQSTIVGQ